MREIEIAPSGQVAVHRHGQRPGVAYILEDSGGHHDRISGRSRPGPNGTVGLIPRLTREALPQGFDAIAQLRRLFKLQIFRRLLHLAL